MSPTWTSELADMQDDRQALRSNLDALMSTGLGWVRSARRLQSSITICLVMGGAVVGSIGGAMEGPLSPATGGGVVTLKGLLVFGGLLAGFLGGILLLIMRDEAPALLARAAELEQQARAFLDERDRLAARQAEMETRDSRRLALIDASKAMMEACENALGAEGLAIEDAIDTVLRAGQHATLHAIDFGGGEYWAVSIFQVDGDELRRVVALRPDTLEERIDGRSWRRGEGFVGMAWLRDAEVVISDANQPEIAAVYVVPSGKALPLDRDRYRSIAVVPIRVGPTDEFWGAVAISSDQAGRFKSNPGDQRVKNVDTVRLIARAVELLVVGRSRCNG